MILGCFRTLSYRIWLVEGGRIVEIYFWTLLPLVCWVVIWAIIFVPELGTSTEQVVFPPDNSWLGVGWGGSL